jgi:hypothetical protein
MVRWSHLTISSGKTTPGRGDTTPTCPESMRQLPHERELGGKTASAQGPWIRIHTAALDRCGGLAERRVGCPDWDQHRELRKTIVVGIAIRTT